MDAAHRHWWLAKLRRRVHDTGYRQAAPGVHDAAMATGVSLHCRNCRPAWLGTEYCRLTRMERIRRSMGAAATSDEEAGVERDTHRRRQAIQRQISRAAH